MLPARPGRTCPLDYATTPEALRRAPARSATTVYTVGGLYGNPEALDALDALLALEPGPVLVVFNGDFHWFDRDPAVFAAIQARIDGHVALRGNVETELASADDAHGCGCAYPGAVPDEEVERSNAIHTILRATAAAALDTPAPLGGLPMAMRVELGGQAVTLVHGDAWSLAGWGFAQDALDDPAARPRIEAALREADTDVFACSHTCLPALRRYTVDGRPRAVINNGAAGMPNLAGTRHGIVSRIALAPPPSALPVLYGTSVGALHVDAVALHYDADAWRARFLADWPPGSPAHRSYFARIERGPAWTLAQARGDLLRSGFPS